MLYVANRISCALCYLPNHILEEFKYEAKYSLIKTLNKYSCKETSSSIKNLIVWRCYSDLSRWWCRTYVGCHELSTQKKYKIFPISKEEIEQGLGHEIDESNDEFLEEVINNEESKMRVQLAEHYRKKLNISRVMFDCLLMTGKEYLSKYPNTYTKKQIDNKKQAIRKMVLEAISKENANKKDNTLI